VSMTMFQQKKDLWKSMGCGNIVCSPALIPNA